MRVALFARWDTNQLDTPAAAPVFPANLEAALVDVRWLLIMTPCSCALRMLCTVSYVGQGLRERSVLATLTECKLLTRLLSAVVSC